MRRAPAKPVRACILRQLRPVSHVTFEAPLRTSHFSLHSSHSTLHTALFTPHTSNCTLHTPHFISSELFSPYPSSSLLICHLSFHESLPSSTTKELACVVRQPGPCVRALCEAVAVLLSKNMTCARPRCNATSSKHFPHTSQCTLHTPTLALHKAEKDDFEALFKMFFKGKLLAPKLRKSADKSLSQPGCSHSNTIYDVQLQKTIVLRMQPRHRATLTQPLQCDLQRLSCKTQKNYAQRCRKLQLQNRISTPKQKKYDFEALFKMIFKRKITSVKIAKIYSQITIAAWMQPLQYDLRSSAEKDNRITHAAAAASNLEHTRFRAPASSPQHRACNIHAAIPMQSAPTDSRNA